MEYDWYDDLEEANRRIHLFEEAERVRLWYKSNPEKKKKHNAKWNTNHRNEYQREYYLKNK